MLTIVLKRVCKNCGKSLTYRNFRFCSEQCSADYRYKDYIKRWKAGLETGFRRGASSSQYVRRYLFGKFKGQCTKCGWSETNPFTGTIPIELEHIDGDYRNCSEENLTLLCPNCHSLTATYKGLNKGKGRPSRRSSAGRASHL